MLVKCILFLCVFAFVKCDGQDTRKPKFLSFDASKDDLQVGLDFSLPFLKIPIKTDGGSPYAQHDLNLPKINVNLSSLLVGGLVFLVTTFISPLLNKPYAPHHRTSRGETELENPLLEFSNEILRKNTGCLERIACLSSQQTQDINTVKTMKRIMRNELLSKVLNMTALEDATNQGLQGKDCSTYVPCSLTKEDFIRVVDNLAVVTSAKSSNAIN